MTDDEIFARFSRMEDKIEEMEAERDEAREERDDYREQLISALVRNGELSIGHLLTSRGGKP